MTSFARQRWARAACFLAPPLLCLAVYWRAPFIWFRIDDFAWLSLPMQVHNMSDLAYVLFHPQAQGTVRVLSERLFFLALTGLFGLYAAPFRAVMLGTWFLDLALIQMVGERMTGSRTAGLLAALLWTANASIALPITWASSYNEVLCAFFVLAAFYARLRWIESGERKWQWAEAAAYLAGFGALEVIVVYPLVVLLHAFADPDARPRWRSTLWTLAPAAAFTLAHFFLIPKTSSPAYRILIDRRLPGNVFRYLGWTLSAPIDLAGAEAIRTAAAVAIGLALAVFALVRIRAGSRTPLFFVGWFLLFLAPILPLPNHVSQYYLTIPGIGLAWLAGAALVAAWKKSAIARTVAVLLTCGYLASSIAEADAMTDWELRVTSAMRVLVRSADAAMKAHPGSALVLKGVSDDLFLAGFTDDPFRLVGVKQVWLAPGEERILAYPGLEDTARFRTSVDELAPLLAHGKARVLDFSPGAPRDVTRRYGAVLRAEFLGAHRSYADVGDPLYASRLGAGWYPPENSSRWTAKRATVTLSGPRSPAERLYVTGYAAPGALTGGSLRLSFFAGGKQIGSLSLIEPDKPFSIAMDLPKDLVGAYSMQVATECSRTFRPANDSRDLGIVIRTFEVR